MGVGEDTFGTIRYPYKALLKTPMCLFWGVLYIHTFWLMVIPLGILYTLSAKERRNPRGNGGGRTTLRREAELSSRHHGAMAMAVDGRMVVFLF